MTSITFTFSFTQIFRTLVKCYMTLPEYNTSSQNLTSQWHPCSTLKPVYWASPVLIIILFWCMILQIAASWPTNLCLQHGKICLSSPQLQTLLHSYHNFFSHKLSYGQIYDRSWPTSWYHFSVLVTVLVLLLNT